MIRTGLILASVVLPLRATPARAEFCWAWVQGNDRAPFECVQAGDPSTTCSWNGGGRLCHVDGNPSDCCIAKPTTTTRSIENRHSDWHACFGDVGNGAYASAAHQATGQLNPPLRGAKWYSMHRQLLLDFDQFREDFPGPDHTRVEWVPWFPGQNMSFEFPSNGCSSPGSVWRRGAEVEPPGVPCDSCVAYPDCLNHRPADQPTRPGSCSTNACNNDLTRYCAADADCGPGGFCAVGLTWGLTPANEVAVITEDGACVVDGVGASCDPGTITQLTSLDQFTNVEQVTDIMDAWFHGIMHSSVATAGSGRCSLPPYGECDADSDCPSVGPCTGGTCAGDPRFACVDGNDCGVCIGNGHAYCGDVNGSFRSVRDPMFWRLHKSLDVVVQAWQRGEASDVVLVLDISGSMQDQDAELNRKYDRAVQAAKMLVDALPETAGGAPNRVGVVIYSNTGTMTRALEDVANIDVDALGNELAAITPSGCTSIGGGLSKAAELLCGTSGCDGRADRRRAIVLLTDGIENTPPCLFNDGASGTCASTCNGTQAATTALFDALGDSQICAVGFGETGSLNGDRLTLLAERQGGIYVQNPTLDPADNGTFHDLKVAFAKCLGQTTPEVEALDPEGRLERWQLASEPTELSVCAETSATFLAGWKREVQPGAMRVLVNAPSGDLVLSNDAAVDSSLRDTWSFQRIPLPHGGEQAGTWRAELIRTHRAYANGFTTDALPASVSLPLVRRQIQRLCPEGCNRVLYFEDQTLGSSSAYDQALDAEEASGLLAPRTTATSAADLVTRLGQGPWDLIVYAHQGSSGPEPYDTQLTQTLCGPSTAPLSQRAIVTDTRVLTAQTCTVGSDCGTGGGCVAGRCSGPGFAHNVCAGGIATGVQNYASLTGDGRLLAGTHALTNRGYSVYSYELRGLEGEIFSSEFPINAQARPGASTTTAAISAMGAVLVDYETQHWFSEVLVDGVGGLNSHKPKFKVRTGDALRPSIYMLPAYVPEGGFDDVQATVTIERPTTGIGNLMLASGMTPVSFGSESMAGRAAGLSEASIATTPIGTFTLNDEGAGGDLHAANYTWTAEIPNQAIVDGMYQYTFNVRLTQNGCTTERELRQSVFVDVGTQPGSSTIVDTPIAGGRRVTITPRDPYGNPWGPGRIPNVSCAPAPACQCSVSDVTDNLNGSYTVIVHTLAGTPGCTITGFGGDLTAGTVKPTVTAPNQTIQRCTPAPRDEQLNASTSHGTLVGTILTVNGRTVTGVPAISGSNPRAVLPVGTTVIRWTATNGSVTTTVNQTVTVTLSEDPAQCCGPAHTLVEGNDFPNFIFRPDSQSYCVFGKGSGDTIFTGSGVDFLSGGSGSDSLETSGAGNVLVGGSGNDELELLLGSGSVYGGSGNDVIHDTVGGVVYGNAGDDFIETDFVAHQIYPGPGRDAVYGGIGNDTVVIHHDCELAPLELLNGGLGNDTLITPLSVAQLALRGVVVTGFENIIVTTANRHLSECF